MNDVIVVKRIALVRNIFLFVWLSVFFLYFVFAIYLGDGPFLTKTAILFLQKFWPFCILMFLTSYSVYNVKSYSRWFLLFFLIIQITILLFIFIYSLDKVILFLFLIYMLFSAYFYILWMVEVSLAQYNPRYFSNIIGPKNYHNLEIVVVGSTGYEYEGICTNWDQESIFVFFDTGSPPINNERIDIKIKYAGLEYKAHGEIIATYWKGVGISFLCNNDDGNIFTWDACYQIVKERGIIANS